MPHVDVLYNQMQSRNIDSKSIRISIDSFCSAIQEIRDSYVCNFFSQAKVSESKEICDRIIVECRERFEFTSHLIAAKLFYTEHFPSFNGNLPKTEISQACVVYPFIAKERLETELSTFYARTELHNFNGLISLLQMLLDENIASVFQETLKLLKILVTIPMTTAEPERCFSTLKRVKTHQRNTMKQERLNALSMISIEKKMISRIPEFNHKVIEKFCRKTRRMDFIWK